MQKYKVTINEQDIYFYKENPLAIMNTLISLARKSVETNRNVITVNGKQIPVADLSFVYKKRPRGEVLGCSIVDDKLTDWVVFNKRKVTIKRIKEFPVEFSYLTTVHDFFIKNNEEVIHLTEETSNRIGLHQDVITVQIVDLIESGFVKPVYKLSENALRLFAPTDYRNDWVDSFVPLLTLLPKDNVTGNMHDILVGFVYLFGKK